MEQLPENIVTVVQERILDNVRFDLTTGCWLWQKALTSGYGVMAVPGHRTAKGNALLKRTHQLTYMAWRGSLVVGMHLDHEVCDRPQCCNPWHVEIKTPKANTLRSTKPGSAGEKSRAGECVNGHSFTEDNVYIHPNRGTRHCKQCKRDRDRAYYATKLERDVRPCRRQPALGRA